MAPSVLEETINQLFRRQIESSDAGFFKEFLVTHADELSAVFKDFVVKHADELRDGFIKALLTPAPATEEFRTPVVVETLPRRTTALPTKRSNSRTSFPDLSAKVAAELRDHPPNVEVVRYRGYRPWLCVEPRCTEKNSGPGTGFTCHAHFAAQPEQRKAWSFAHTAEARRQLGLPPAGRRTPAPKKDRAPSQAQERDNLIRGFLLSVPKEGAAFAEIKEATELPDKYLRRRLYEMSQRGMVRTEGVTKNARWFAAQ